MIERRNGACFEWNKKKERQNRNKKREGGAKNLWSNVLIHVINKSNCQAVSIKDQKC